MPTKQEKIDYIRAYSAAQMQLAISYRDAVSVIEKLSDRMVDMMYQTAVQTNSLRNDICNDQGIP